MKRKRSSRAGSGICPKRIKGDDSSHYPTKHSVLRLHYRRVHTLRQYLLSKLGKASKSRRRLVAQYGIGDNSEDDVALVRLLDEVIVCTTTIATEESEDDLTSQDLELSIFSQEVSESTGRSSSAGSALSQVEIINYTIWSLFRRFHSLHKPPHILCHGLIRSGTANPNALQDPEPTTIPGILSTHRNEYVEMLKASPWSLLSSLLGRRADKVLFQLFKECGIFAPLDHGHGNLVQLSGTPLSDLKQIVGCSEQDAIHTAENHNQAVKPVSSKTGLPHTAVRGLNSIRFVRHRILYGKPSLNARSNVRFGLRQTHVLNRSTDLNSRSETIHLMKYIFPRQFGLHNVFTSDVDPRETAQAFKDYTLREKEIKRILLNDPRSASKIPKRLRGDCENLITRLRRKHIRCSYVALLQHYCPVISTETDSPSVNAMGVASAASQVSAFCRSVISHVFPYQFWGDGDAGIHNKTRIMRYVDQFVAIRRYESITLHNVLQDIKITGIPWLAPPNQENDKKISNTDLVKRRELFAELIYYLFDSFLVPLINSNFHVTESSAHRNQLFYFRHDVWKRLAEPTLAAMKTSMFEELSPLNVKRLLSRRGLGTSQVRLLPKETGLRPIINLRRRVMTRINGEMVLARSINSILTPVFNVLNYEKSKSPQRLGASLFSADDIFPRLRQFRNQLNIGYRSDKPLYFAKLDVRSCFDTIPQGPLMTLLGKLFTAKGYVVSRYAEAKTLSAREADSSITPKVVLKYLGKAQPTGTVQPFSEKITRDASSKQGTVFVDSVVQRQETHSKLLSLLSEHIERNVVQIGRKYYRQKTGIPQGSIVSSLLCSFFYAELEKEVLSFLDPSQSLLLRLIDDFLLISTDREAVTRFVHTMHAGVPEYGLSIKRAKSLVNFDVQVDGMAITRLAAVTDFPYCGNAINTTNLHITKDQTRRQQNNLAAAITVEYSKAPGQTFYRKMLNMLKLHMHAMHLCTAHNGLETALSNLHHAFSDTSERCIRYMRSLPQNRSPSITLLMKQGFRPRYHTSTLEGLENMEGYMFGDRGVHGGVPYTAVMHKRYMRYLLKHANSPIETANDLVDVAFGIMQRKRDKASSDGSVVYECAITKSQTRWLALCALHQAFSRRQTRFGEFLAWLEEQTVRAGLALHAHDRRLVDKIARGGGARHGHF